MAGPTDRGPMIKVGAELSERAQAIMRREGATGTITAEWPGGARVLGVGKPCDTDIEVTITIKRLEK